MLAAKAANLPELPEAVGSVTASQVVELCKPKADDVAEMQAPAVVELVEASEVPDAEFAELETSAALVVEPSETAAAHLAIASEDDRAKGAHILAVYLDRLAPTSRVVQRSSLNTIAKHQGRLQGVKVTAETLDWHHLRYEHVQRIRAWLAESKAPATANRMLSALRGIVRESWRLGYMASEDYQRAVDVPNVRGSRVSKGRQIGGGEQVALVQHCDNGTIKGARDAAILACMFAAGMRRAEIVGLNMSDYRDGVLYVIGKGNKERTIPMTNGAKSALDAWVALRAERFACTTCDNPCECVSNGALFCPVRRWDRPRWGARLNASSLRDLSLALAAGAHVQPFNPHDGRRTCATTMIDTGADIFAVQAAMGHSNVQTTQRYDLSGDRRKADALSRVHFPYMPRK